MGVQIYVLDRRCETLSIAGLSVGVGTLRRFWKFTELNAERLAEIDRRKAEISGHAVPALAMVAEVEEFPLAVEPERPIPVHRVIGWEQNRVSVSDWNWDDLPVLGFAVRNSLTNTFVLYHEKDGLLHQAQ